MTDDDPNNTWACYGCVGDDYLVAEIKENGVRHKCTFCSRRRKCYSLATIGDRVHPIFLERYHPTDDYDRGETPRFCIAEIIGSDEEPVAEALVNYLSDRYGGWPGDGDVNAYGDAYTYIASDSDGRRYARKWKELAQSLRHESRYFNRKAHTILDEIFDGLNFGIEKPSNPLLESFFRHKSIVTTLNPGDRQAVLYRAREARDESVVAHYLRDPVTELAAPPPRLARAGRMNPTGISLFYGSFDPETCIAEIRPPVGTYAVIGRFELLRPLRLLDFEKLTDAFEPVSHFHPQYAAKQDRDAFLKAFEFEISIPVHPQEENLGYLPTQAVAEYLAQRQDLKLDGLIFRSTQSGRDGKNVVLFQHAAHVEPPTHTYEAEWYEPFEDLPEITVVATLIPPVEPAPTPPPTDEIPSAFEIAEQTSYDDPIEPPGPPPSPRLRLDPTGFHIEVIGTVRYAHAGLRFTYTTAADKAAKANDDQPF